MTCPSPSPFSASADAPAQSRLGRRRRRPDPAGAATALERLVAREWPAPSRASVVTALQQFHVRGDDARIICVALFVRAMASVAADHAISVQEADQLKLNKRCIFDGRARQVAILHSDVVALGVYADGFILEKSVGKSPFLTIDGDAALAAVLAAEALARDWT